MKKTFRYYVTFLIVRVVLFAIKIIGKNGTNFPGKVALKLCPDFLGMIDIPDTVICVTGTNGKTTTSNIITDTLRGMGHEVVSNRAGSNMVEGVTSALILTSSFFGKCSTKYAVFEIDELSSKNVYKFVKPNYLVYTNQYRDSIRREAHAEYVFNRINEVIPKDTFLVLNGDDPISLNAGKDNKKVYFGINVLDGEEEYKDSRIKDIIYDYNTFEKLDYSFVRFHHLGKIKKVTPRTFYAVDDILDNTINVAEDGVLFEYNRIGATFMDTYNQVAAIALLREMGFDKAKISESMAKVVIPKSRFDKKTINGRNLYFLLSKGQSPIAASRNNEFIASLPEKSAVLLMNEEQYIEALNSAWFHEIDYEYLIKDNVVDICTAGYFCKEFHICLRMAGVDEAKISSYFEYNDAAKNINIKDVDNIFVLYGLDTIHFIGDVRKILESRMENTDEN